MTNFPVSREFLGFSVNSKSDSSFVRAYRKVILSCFLIVLLLMYCYPFLQCDKSTLVQFLKRDQRDQKQLYVAYKTVLL